MCLENFALILCSRWSSSLAVLAGSIFLSLCTGDNPDNSMLVRILHEVSSAGKFRGIGCYLLYSVISYNGTGYGMQCVNQAMKQKYIVRNDEDK